MVHRSDSYLECRSLGTFQKLHPQRCVQTTVIFTSAPPQTIFNFTNIPPLLSSASHTHVTSHDVKESPRNGECDLATHAALEAGITSPKVAQKRKAGKNFLWPTNTCNKKTANKTWCDKDVLEQPSPTLLQMQIHRYIILAGVRCWQ